MQKTTVCSICNYDELLQAIDLPKFPFTGIYVKEKLSDKMLADQSLLFCPNCAHGQLGNIIDYQDIYNETYTHRGSKSPIATQGNDFFLAFLKKISHGRGFQRVLDIGCNDGYLLSKIEPYAKRLVGVDPIWQGRDHSPSDKTELKGGFIEEIDYVQALQGVPDLVVSAHTFEHIQKPKEQLLSIVDQANDDTLFVIEVPSFDTLIMNHRFDQVFHQHIHYYSLSSFSHLIKQLHCEYIAHEFNRSFWGGTMLIAFKKSKGTPTTPNFYKHTIDDIKTSFQIFKNQLHNVMSGIHRISSRKIYGYGAAQMLPALAYHMNSDLSFLESILDDNPSRNGLTYPNLNVSISLPNDLSFKHIDILITALDSTTPILKKLINLNIPRIILPLNII